MNAEKTPSRVFLDVRLGPRPAHRRPTRSSRPTARNASDATCTGGALARRTNTACAESTNRRLRRPRPSPTKPSGCTRVQRRRSMQAATPPRFTSGWRTTCACPTTCAAIQRGTRAPEPKPGRHSARATALAKSEAGWSPFRWKAQSRRRLRHNRRHSRPLRAFHRRPGRLAPNDFTARPTAASWPVSTEGPNAETGVLDRSTHLSVHMELR